MVCSFEAKSQSIVADGIPSVVEEIWNKNLEDVHFAAFIRNQTNNPVTFKLKVEIIEIAPTHSLSYCWNLCYETIYQDYEYPQLATLGPNESSTLGQFKFYLFPYRFVDGMTTKSDTGTTRIRIKFINVDNENDFSSYEITFKLKGTSSIIDGRETDDFSIVAIHPNPATSLTNVDINYKEEDKSLKFEIFDAQGNVKSEESVCSCYGKKIPLNLDKFSPGVYYLRLSNQDKYSKIEKLVIIK